MSDGKPWRPLIHVKDMGRAIDWAIHRKQNDSFIVLNAGSNKWNYQVKDLALAVKEIIPEVEVSINEINKTIRSVLVAPEIRETSNIVRDNNNNITSSETIIKKPNGRIVREKSEALSYSGPFLESHQESLTQ